MPGTCFVVMGFGKKTDFESGRTLDLDKSYHNMIKPAVEAAGLECVRADECVHSGLIDIPMYDWLFNADVVIADLSTANTNAFYELGTRHALRPYSTIVIADKLTKVPFDVNRITVRRYQHLGEDIGYSEVVRFKDQLTAAIQEITAKQPQDRLDSPVYSFLHKLRPPVLESLASPMPSAATRSVAAGENASAAEPDAKTHGALMQQVDAAQSNGDFVAAKHLLMGIRALMQAQSPAKEFNSPDIIQRLALVTYKSEAPSKEAALHEASQVLSVLNPETSNDTETLGLWGAIHKRLWSVRRDMQHLDAAIRAYERGFYLRNDYYNGINFAFLLNMRAAEAADPADAVTDTVLARRVRAEVGTICQAWLAQSAASGPDAPQGDALPAAAETRYWVLATLAEATFGQGDLDNGRKQLKDAYAQAPQAWMARSTQDQIAELEGLLAKTASLRVIGK